MAQKKTEIKRERERIVHFRMWGFVATHVAIMARVIMLYSTNRIATAAIWENKYMIGLKNSK